MHYIPREAEHRVRQLLAEFPIVLLLGARQTGKTMLARHLAADWLYLDMENHDDRQRVASDLEFFFRTETGPVCFDEAQLLPELFAHLRTVADRFPQRRFLLLGSAGPALDRAVSESLAGRCATIELSPLTIREAEGISVGALWFEGGYPRLRQLRAAMRLEWNRQYVNAFTNRDIPAMGLTLSTARLQRLVRMVAVVQGAVANVARLAASLGCSTTAVSDALDVLEHTFIIRRLPPFSANLRKRLVKAPKLYVRDSGLLLALLRIPSLRDLLAHPTAGASWEGFVIQQTLATLTNRGTDADAFFYRTHAGAEADLVLDFGTRRRVVEVKLGAVGDERNLRGLKQVMEDTGAEDGWVVTYSGDDRRIADRIRQTTLPVFLNEVAGKD
jgi:uncharacterized protein